MKTRGKSRWVTVVTLFVFVLGSQTLGADPVAEETAVSLNGVWHIQPTGGAEQEIAVPGFWERAPGLRDVHEATYTRTFDVPESFAGRRVLLRFDAVGDAADVSVNGQYAGDHAGACLPFEVDITGLVAVPSTGNQAGRGRARRLSFQRRASVERPSQPQTLDAPGHGRQQS